MKRELKALTLAGTLSLMALSAVPALAIDASLSSQTAVATHKT